LGLFAAGIVLLLLLIASYSRRSTWLALGSMALSIAVVAACLLLVAIRDPSQGRVRLAWIESKLPLVLDQQTADAVAASLERIAAVRPCAAAECDAPAADPPPPLVEREPMQASATAGWFDTQAEPKAATYPVAWSLDDGDAQAPVTSPWGFSINGTNVASEALEDVQAVLKPDSTEREIELALDVEGPAHDAQAVIPPNARFGLISATPYDAKQGGAILTFRYVQAGQRKSSILYLSPSMVARLASRG
jgi:hypothetical protein